MRTGIKKNLSYNVVNLPICGLPKNLARRKVVNNVKISKKISSHGIVKMHTKGVYFARIYSVPVKVNSH